MKILSIEDYSEFECIGSACPLCCCGGGWNIVIDSETAEYYRNVEGEFGDELRSHMTEVDGNTKFILDENEDCHFLNENGLCRIYRTLGEDKMCYTCKNYPRERRRVGDIIFCYLTTSCPEVTRKIMERTGRVQVDFQEKKPTQKEEKDLKKEKIDWKHFNYAIRAYTTGMDILQNDNLQIKERVLLLMMFLKEFQELMKEKKDPSELLAFFSTKDAYPSLMDDFTFPKPDLELKVKAFQMVFWLPAEEFYDLPTWKKCRDLYESLRKTPIINKDEAGTAFLNEYTDEIRMEMEQILCYRFFSIFHLGYQNNSYYEQMVYELVLCEALFTYHVLSRLLYGESCTKEDRILFYSISSRIDHGKSKEKRLKEAIRKEGLLDLETLIKMIS